jgi:hypothetical protein
MSSPIWGYLDQAGAVSLASSFAQEFVRLRNELAPNVLLAYPHERLVLPCAAREFDVAFEDFSDREAGFYADQQGNAKTWFTPADFARHRLYARTFVRLAGVRMVAWQIPLGNTVMRAMNNTWDHYQDNRVQWLLGDGSRTRLPAYVAAGFLGFLFGRGADGDVRVRRSRRRRHEPGANRRQHRGVGLGRRRRWLLQAAVGGVLPGGGSGAAVGSRGPASNRKGGYCGVMNAA